MTFGISIHGAHWMSLNHFVYSMIFILVLLFDQNQFYYLFMLDGDHKKHSC